MTRLALRLIAAVLLVCTCQSSIAAGLSAVRYRLTDLGDLTSTRARGVTFVSGINEKGEIVGQTFNDQSQARAFLWQKGRMTDLGDLGLANGQTPILSAFAVNKDSRVVGTSMGGTSPSPIRAFYWDHDRIRDLGTVGGMGNDTFATSINEHGDIVGAGYRSPGDLRALRWMKKGPVELGGLPDGRVAVQAFGIGEHRRAFLWEEGTLLDLGKAASKHTSSEARAINKDGTVVGVSGTGSVTVAWVWREGGSRERARADCGAGL